MKPENHIQSIDEIDWYDPTSLLIDKAEEFRRSDKMIESYRMNTY